MIMNLHTHTHHSPDGGSESVADRLALAESIGLQIMAVTDHCEVNRYYPAEHYHAVASQVFDYDSQAVMEGSLAETTACKGTNPNVKLLCGVELGQIPQEPELSQRLYNDPRLDLVIGSVHELPNMADFYFLDYTNPDMKPLITAYFDEVLALAQTDAWDILGHLTYGMRYMPNRADYDITPHLPIIDEIFRTVIAKGKAIELNGSMLKSPAPFTDPDLTLLKRYRSLGGQYLTISTDAHHGAYLDYRMNELEQMAADAGFTHLTYFERHQPMLVSL